MEMIDLKNLTAEQRAELKQELANEIKAKEATRKSELETYQQLKDVTVEKVYARLQQISSEMEDSKTDLLKEFHSLLDIKNELYDVKETQLSHSWTNKSGTVTIITGFNTIDRWDETVTAGIAKVNEWLDNKVSVENKDLVGLIRELLKPNKDGVLKANRVLDLQNQVNAIGDADLINAVRMIAEAHRPEKTGTYIKAKYKDNDGNSHFLGLSMSSV